MITDPGIPRPSALSPYSIFETLSAFIPFYQYIVVTGNFNADLLSPRKPETGILKNLMNTHDFSIVSTEPTHHLLHTDPPSHTALDLFLVRYFESEHPPKTIICRNLKTINADQLHQLISS